MRKLWDVGFAADRADRTFVYQRAAVWTPPHQHLAAERTEPPADRIGRRTIWMIKRLLLDLIHMIRRAMRIRTESFHSRFDHPRLRCRHHRLGVLQWLQRNPELLCYLLDDLITQFRRSTLLEHRQRRLLAADLFGQFYLADLRRSPRIAQLDTDLWT